METESVGLVERMSTPNGVEFDDASIRGNVSRILVRDSGTLHVVKVRDVEWIDACGNYVEIHTGGRTFLQRETLSGIARRLSSRQFVRIHRSMMVNTHKVREVRTLAKGQYSLIMASGVELPTQRPIHEIHDMVMAG